MKAKFRRRWSLVLHEPSAVRHVADLLTLLLEHDVIEWRFITWDKIGDPARNRGPEHALLRQELAACLEKSTRPRLAAHLRRETPAVWGPEDAHFRRAAERADAAAAELLLLYPRVEYVASGKKKKKTEQQLTCCQRREEKRKSREAAAR